MRVYKPPLGTKKNCNYDTTKLEQAIESVKAGNNSIREAAVAFGVPKSTLHNRLHIPHPQPIGRPRALTDAEEKELVATLSIASAWGFPIEVADIPRIVKGYLDANKIQKSNFVENLPGYEWVNGFFKRHKADIVSKKPQYIKKARAKISCDVINLYFDNLEGVLADVPPSHIVNYDETNCVDDPARKNVVIRRRDKHADRVLDSSRAAQSVMFACTGDGKLLPPYVVYKALNVYKSWTEAGPAGARYAATKSGWFDMSTFEDWFFAICLPYFSSLDTSEPRVLIGDNVASHVSIRVINACISNNIRFCFLPPNSTHITQPLDVAVFRGFKIKWRSVLLNHKKKRNCTLQKSDFPKLLKQALSDLESKMSNNISSGFRACGIIPLNREAVLKNLPDYSNECK